MPARRIFCNSCTVCSLPTSWPKLGFFLRLLCSQSTASAPLKQFSTVFMRTRCLLHGIPAWKERTISFQSLVARQGPLITPPPSDMTRPLSSYCPSLTIEISNLRRSGFLAAAV